MIKRYTATASEITPYTVVFAVTMKGLYEDMSCFLYLWVRDLVPRWFVVLTERCLFRIYCAHNGPERAGEG